jgi:hypothetical protein
MRRENVLIISTFHDFPPATDCDKPLQIFNCSPHKNPHSLNRAVSQGAVLRPGAKFRFCESVAQPPRIIFSGMDHASLRRLETISTRDVDFYGVSCRRDYAMTVEILKTVLTVAGINRVTSMRTHLIMIGLGSWGSCWFKSKKKTRSRWELRVSM